MASRSLITRIHAIGFVPLWVKREDVKDHLMLHIDFRPLATYVPKALLLYFQDLTMYLTTD